MPENFLEINGYFSLTSYRNTIGQSNNTFYILGFFRGKMNSPCFDLIIHWLVKQITNTIFQGHTKIVLKLARRKRLSFSPTNPMRYVTFATVKDLMHGGTLSLFVSTVCIILHCKDMYTAELPTCKLARMG